MIATLADVVAGMALHEQLPAGTGAATADLDVHFLSAVTVGPAHAEAWVRRGTHSAVTQVEVYDAGRDVLAAICTLAFAVVQLRDGQYDPKSKSAATA
jgi:acyl-coenzyme A thioesterase PaaI-like protein